VAENPIAQFRLDGRVVVLTGASSGLGHHFAGVLAGAGAAIVLCARRTERIEELAASLPLAVAVAGDITSDADRQRIVQVAIATYGHIDVLVNNAGTIEVAPALEESAENFRRVLEVNLTGPFLLTQLVARRMVGAGGGVIVNVASVLGLLGNGRIPQASYAASKGGIVNLTRTLAAEWAPSAIRVNALAPGWFASEMTEEMFASESGQRFIERNTPMGRAGTTEELDGALLFLVSSASSFVTGQVLCVDGGWTAI
jgi:NAD(P)-dependent dehydrogenase (short-subunit alcohol dehydrogenase family)